MCVYWVMRVYVQMYLFMKEPLCVNVCLMCMLSFTPTKMHTYSNTHTHAHTHIYVYTHTHIYIYIYVCISVISSRCPNTMGMEYSYIEYMREFI